MRGEFEWYASQYQERGVDFLHGHSARGAFMRTWELINGAESWAANPWVAAISFRVIKANIDSLEAKA